MRLFRLSALVFVLVAAAAALPGIAAAQAADTVAPSAPVALTLAASPGKVALAWGASTDNVGVAGYQVWRRDNPGSNWSQIAQTQSLSYADSTAAIGYGYAYAVRAYDAAGNVSASSTIIPTTVPADTQPPSAPGNLTATVALGSVTLAWSAGTDNVGVAGYRVWRRDEPGTNWSQIAQTASLKYVDTTVLAGRSYAYAVGAYDAAGNVSVMSPSAAATITAATSPAASGSIVWTADASQPLDAEWGSMSTQDRCAVTTAPGVTSARVSVVNDATVPSPTGKLYRLGIADGDNCYGERAELGQANPMKWSNRLFFEGQDRWISWSVRLGPNFPTSTNAWQVISQWKQATAYPGGNYGGSPKFAMELWGGHWYMNFTSYDPSDQWNTSKGAHRDTFGGTPVPNRWVKFTMHVLFSDDPNVGTFTLYGDMNDGLGWRTLVPLEHTPTLLKDVPATGNSVPSHLRVGIYRNQNAYAGNTNIDFAGITVATTRAMAEANAFR